MASSVEISIPSAQTSDTSKPFTLYNVSLRLPLRSFNVQKRYSDFATLHTTLTSQAGSAPPASLPQKSWFSRTVSNPELTEERRTGLQSYLRIINQAEDGRWRNTSAWRAFLNLPSNTSTRSNTASTLYSAITGPGSGAPITDPVVWLDCHRDLKSQLHDARLQLTRRDQATAAQAQHECSAQAKKCLIKAGTMIVALEQGLKSLESRTWGKEKLGEGELRRRRDLVGSGKREKEGLENLLSAMVAKSQVDKTVATVQDKHALVGNGPTRGRVLGKETDKTRALDNQGVLQLQKQLIQDQDEDVMVLAQAVSRQKELGIAIQEELQVQNEMLGMLDEDVTRVQGKIDVAKKRVAKIH
ncbi:hypothetical protein MMC12_007640 [Toensbergia leucococca]|nr:hypothetical protein [Toensbergia leucococca]